MITFLRKTLSTFIFTLFGLLSLSTFNLTIADSPYATTLSQTVSGSLGSVARSNVADGQGAQLFNEQIIKLIDYVIYIFIAIGIAIAFVGGYKIMASDKEDSTKEGIRLVIFGIVGIIIMVSANFIASALVGDDGVITGEFVSQYSNDIKPSGVQIAANLYGKVLYPFIKLLLYFVIGILFFIMAAKVIKFATSTDDSTKKKSLGVILWSVIGIFVVMGSKQIVEAIMGNQERVLNEEASQISEMGNEILEFEKIQLISQIINWVMGLTMLVILVLIIIQGYKMFAKPDDPKNRESLKKTLLYVIIGVLVIGASYVISNVLVVNRL